MVGAVRTADADVRPVVPGAALEVTVLVQNPLPVGRPARAKIEMVRVSEDADAICAVRIARPDLVASRAREMERYAPSVRAKTQPVREPFAGPRKLAGVGAIELHAENLPDLVPHDLHEDALIADEQRRRVENCEALAGRDFRQRIAVEIVKP